MHIDNCHYKHCYHKICQKRKWIETPEPELVEDWQNILQKGISLDDYMRRIGHEKETNPLR